MYYPNGEQVKTEKNWTDQLLDVSLKTDKSWADYRALTIIGSCHSNQLSCIVYVVETLRYIYGRIYTDCLVLYVYILNKKKKFDVFFIFLSFLGF